MKIISVTNQKGGVGKTTISSHIAFGLAESGHKTLLVDLDSQGQAGIYLTGDKDLIRRPDGAERLFSGEWLQSGSPSAVTPFDNLYLLHGHNDLVRLDESRKPEEVLRLRLEIRAGLESAGFDFVVMDTPPALAFRQIAAVILADRLVTVVEPEEKAMSGLARVNEVIKLMRIKGALVPDFAMKILLNKVDLRVSEQKKVVEAMQEKMPQLVLPLVIPARPGVINKAYSARVPVWNVKGADKDFSDALRRIAAVVLE